MSIWSKRSLGNIRKICIALVVVMTFQIVYPVTAYALTSGPSQPEVQSFKPVGATQMVDLFSGDFSYNIPLLEVPGSNGGYPINLFYNSVTDAETEASMVGLGWNVGIGAVTTNVRGIPDAFNGEMITTKTDMRDSWTFGLGVSVSNPAVDTEIIGGDFGKLLEEYKEGSSIVETLNPISFGAGATFLADSHKGFGFSIEPDIRVSMGNAYKHTSLNLGLSLNSLEGSSISPGVSFLKKGGRFESKGGFGGNIGLSFNSDSGLNMSLGMHASKDKQKIPFNMSSSFSFARPAYTPSVNPEFEGKNIGLNISLGGDFFFADLNGNFRGFYSKRSIKPEYRTGIQSPAYGHLYAQNANGDNALMDFNKEKDGPLYGGSTNLSVPFATPDVISVNGQGVSGSFMTMRSDQGGALLNQADESRTRGGNLGLEFAPGVPAGVKVGLNPGANWSRSFTKRTINNGNNEYNFHGKSLGDDFEPSYIKASSDVTAEINDTEENNMGGDAPVKRTLFQGGYDAANIASSQSPDDVDNSIGGELFGLGFEFSPENPLSVNDKRDERKPRNSPVQNITNRDLQGDLQPIYNVGYYDEGEIIDSDFNFGAIDDFITRSNNDQIGAYTSLTPDGLRYVYALPVMNKEKHEVTFSTDSITNECARTINIPIVNNQSGKKIDRIDYNYGDQYLKHIETPAHATSHLLTSVIGADYVDVDPIDGLPNIGDRGYWMRVDYFKTGDFKWKSPFKGANAIRGAATKRSDDKGTFTAGVREQFYPARIVTNTHEARYYYEERKDARGANSLVHGLNESSLTGAKSYKLMKIELYSQKELQHSTDPTPIKTVHFKYADENNPESEIPELCKNSENSTGNGAKLTLEAVWFTYRDNNKGALNPYKFKYGTNPNYDPLAFDRWGVFRKAANPTERCYNFNEPYVNQNPLNEQQLNDDIAAWHLKKIKLPSGSTIELEIARDHYAYVQDRVATQMTKIAGFEEPAQAGDHLDLIPKTKVEDEDISKRRIYFDLETPIKVGDEADIDKYLEDLPTRQSGGKEVKQIFYKLHVDLLNVNTPNAFDTSTGYLDILTEPGTYGVDINSQTSDGYIKGYVTVDLLHKLEGRASTHHPMAVLNWQYIKTMLSDQMYGVEEEDMPTVEDEEDEGQMGNFVGSALARWRKVADVFHSYYAFCKRKNYGIKVDLNRSFIKLNSPDKRKYGGGVRVEKVVMKDNDWQSVEKTPSYGVIYEYEKEEEIYDLQTKQYVKTGNTISSGVALNEPAVGTEENALRYAKNFTNDIKALQDQAFFFEYPINESLYPGASVGYSKVTVKSLATDLAIKKANPNYTVNTSDEYEDANKLLIGFAASGVTINEFYTAKDFPVITRETPLDKFTLSPTLPIPLIGQLSLDYFTASQGYTIELNDMHGKPKKTETFGLDEQGNVMADKPISWSEYIYQSEDEIYTPPATTDTKHRKRLTNEVDVVRYDDATLIEAVVEEGVELGVDRQFFTSAENKKSRSYSVGLDINLNVEIPLVPLFAAFPWPSFSFSGSSVKTATTNKIINKKGILKKAIAYDGQSRVETENRLFDPMTGSAILTVVNNNFDDPIYSYNIPARFSYENTGAAYENLGYTFEATSNSDCSSGDNIFSLSLTGATDSDLLREGDEYLIYNKPNNVQDPLLSPIGRGTLLDMDGFKVKSDFDLSNNNYAFKVIRSGKRNHLTASVGSIVGLKDPTEDRIAHSCDVDVVIPTLVPIETCQINPAFQAYIDLQQAIMDNGDWDGMAGDDLINFSEVPYNTSEYQNYLNIINGSLATGNVNTLDINDDEIVVLGGSCQGAIPCENDYELDIVSAVSDGITNDVIGATDICIMHTSNIPISDINIDVVCVENGQESFADIHPSIGIPVHESFSITYNTTCHINVSWDQLTYHPCDRSDRVYLRVTIPNTCGGTTTYTSPLTNGNDDGFSSLIRRLGSPRLERVSDANTVSLDAGEIDCGNNLVPVVYTNTNTSEVTVEYFDGIGYGDCYIPATIPATGYEIQEEITPFTQNYIEIDSVLQSSAMTMRPDWILEETMNCAIQEHSYQEGNAFATAENGVWRLHETHAFVGNEDRRQSEDVDTREDGTYVLEMFNHINPLANSCTNRWKKVEEVTRYSSNGAALESKDALGIYSSALYGYNNHLPVAVAANAGFPEIAYEGFEEFTSLNPNTEEGRESGHISYLTSCTTSQSEISKGQLVFPIHPASFLVGYELGFDALFFLNMSSQEANQILGKEFTSSLTCTDSELYTAKGTILSTYPIPSIGGYVAFINYDECEGDVIPPFNLDGSNKFGCFGFVVTIDLGTDIITSTTSGSSNDGISLETGIAHTGKKCLKVSNKAVIHQDNLNLRTGEKYIFSAWIHMDDNDTPTFKNKFDLHFNGVSMKPSGNIINGWQRIEQEFTYNGLPPYLIMDGLSGGINQPKTPFYIDDIRIFPFNGNIQTYVYDPVDYRVTEILDNNNFYTRYSYDSEGNVISVAKETQEGVKTIQEAGSYIRPTN